MELESAQETIKHPRKDACEDFCSVNYFPESDVSLFLVCDGVSGKEGEKGSHFAANFLRDSIRSALLKNKRERDKPENVKLIEKIIDEEFKRASERMLNEVKAATTLELALFEHKTQKLYTAHCGDSEMYLVRGNASDYPFSGAKIEPFTTPHVDVNTGGPLTRLGPGGYDRFDPKTFDISAMNDEHVFLLMTTDWIRERNLREFTLKRGFEAYKRGDDIKSILRTTTDFYYHPRELLLDKIKTWMAIDQFKYVMEELKKLDFSPDLERLGINVNSGLSSEELNKTLYQHRMKIFSQILSPDAPNSDEWTKRLALIYDIAEGKIYDDFTAVVVDLKGSRRQYFESTFNKNTESITQLTTRAQSAETSLLDTKTQLEKKTTKVNDLEQRVNNLNAEKESSEQKYRRLLEDAAVHIYSKMNEKKEQDKRIAKQEKDKIREMRDDELYEYITTNFSKTMSKARERKGILEQVGIICYEFRNWRMECKRKQLGVMKDKLASAKKEIEGVRNGLRAANEELVRYKQSYIFLDEHRRRVEEAMKEKEQSVKEGYKGWFSPSEHKTELDDLERRFNGRIGKDLYSEEHVQARISGAIERYKASVNGSKTERVTPPPIPEEAKKQSAQSAQGVAADVEQIKIKDTEPIKAGDTEPLSLECYPYKSHTSQGTKHIESVTEPQLSESNLVKIINEKTVCADDTTIKKDIIYGLFYVLEKRKKTKKDCFDYTSKGSGCGEHFGKQLKKTIYYLYKLEKKKEKVMEDKKEKAKEDRLKALIAEQMRYADKYIEQESGMFGINDKKLRHGSMVDFLRDIYNVMDHNNLLEDKNIEEGDKLNVINPSLKKSIDDYFSQAPTASSMDELPQIDKTSSRKWWKNKLVVGVIVSIAFAAVGGVIYYYSQNEQPAKTEKNQAGVPLPTETPPATPDKNTFQRFREYEHKVLSSIVIPAEEAAKQQEERKQNPDILIRDQGSNELGTAQQSSFFKAINDMFRMVGTSQALSVIEKPKPANGESADSDDLVKLVGNDKQQSDISTNQYSTKFKDITDCLNKIGYTVSCKTKNSCGYNFSNNLFRKEIYLFYDTNGITLKGKVYQIVKKEEKKDNLFDDTDGTTLKETPYPTLEEEKRKKEVLFSYILILNNNGVTIQGKYYQLSTDTYHNSWVFGCVDNKKCKEPKERQKEGKAFASFDTLTVEHYIKSTMGFELKDGKLELSLQTYGNNTVYDASNPNAKHIKEYKKVLGENIMEGVKLAFTILEYIKPTR